MLKLAVGTGLDGVMVNYNYRWNCACPYCQADFRRWLGGRFSADELRKKFGIVNLATHPFDEINARIPGYPATNAPALDREEMRWAATAYKRVFDEIFIDYGRSLKKDLIVATWNHLSDMSVFEERAFLPFEQWGRGENYFWYSEGNVPTKLAEHKLGDSWVDCLWLREMGGGKPFMLGKYEPIRVRNNVAEALATGGSGMGLYMTISEPEGYRQLSAYLRFPRKAPELYQGLEPAADCAFLWPRVAIQAGDFKAAGNFRDAVRILSERQVPFEVLADGNVTTCRLARYTTLLLPQGATLSPSVNGMLDDFARRGGSVRPVTKEAALGLADQLKAKAQYAVDAPWTVKVMPWTGKGRRVLHLVNYNRDEARSAGLPQNPVAECPIAAEKITCQVVMPRGAQVSSVRLYAPEAAKPESLPFEVNDVRVCFVIPRVEVYAVVEILCSLLFSPQ